MVSRSVGEELRPRESANGKAGCLVLHEHINEQRRSGCLRWLCCFMGAMSYRVRPTLDGIMSSSSAECRAGEWRMGSIWWSYTNATEIRKDGDIESHDYD